MNPLVIPWIAVPIGIGWMVFMGLRAKRTYLLRKSEEEAKARVAEEMFARVVEEQRHAAELAAIDERQTRLFANR